MPRGRRRSQIPTAGNAPRLNVGAARDCPPNATMVQPNPTYAKSEKFYGLWANLGARGANQFANQATPPLNSTESLLQGQVEDPMWWTVDVWAREVSRDILVGTAPPLTRAQIIADGQRFSRLKVRISWESVLPHSFDLDVGDGIHVSFLGTGFRVEALLPQFNEATNESGYRQSPEPDTGEAYGPGLLTDTVLGVSAYPSWAPTGEKSGTFTQFIVQPATVATAIDIPVPPGAKFLTAYQTPDPLGTPLQWIQAIGATLAVPVGSLIFPADGRIDRVKVPQNCSTLRVPVGASVNNRGWNLVWCLEF